MEYGFLTLCFEKEIRSRRMDHKQVLEWASKNGFDGVEVYLPTLPGLSWHYIDQIRKSLKEYSLSVSQVSHATGFLCLDEESKRYRKRYYSLAAEVASILESPYLRATSGVEIAGIDKAVSLSVDALSPILDLAEDYNLYITLENHPGVENTYAVLSAIFQKCGSKWLKLNFDTVNSLEVGENPLEILKNLSSLLVHIHACDAVRKERYEKTVVGRGLVPWRQIMSFLKAVGYTGYLSIEYFGEDPKQTLVQSKDCLKTLEATS